MCPPVLKARRDELLTHLGCAKDDSGWVATGRTGRTSFLSPAVLLTT